MQTTEKTASGTTTTAGAPAQPGCQGCGQCQCAKPATASQPIVWERKKSDDTEGGEL